jgi:polygalacturonase
MKLYVRNQSLIIFFTLLFSLSGIYAQGATSQNYYNVLDFGVKNDGVTKNTLAIKKIISSVAEKGGGTIYFPAGEYLTGPIHLKTNITLYLDAGSIIKFSQDMEDYLPMVQSRWEGTEVVNFSPQIYAYKAESITIRGRGLIDGKGSFWWEYLRKYARNPDEDQLKGRLEWQKKFVENNKDTPPWNFWDNKRGDMPAPFLRPPMIQPVDCKNILIEGVSIKNPPFWTINPVYCENLTVEGITITNPDHSPNTDGINPDACRYVHISNCHLSVGDDCITIKSGRDEDGRRVGRACENITITNCTMLDGHGGVVIGSEMSGDVRKVTISNCVFDGTDRGIRLKSMRGRGGIVEEIRVNNIVMKNIARDAIILNMFYHPTPEEPVSERTPRFRNIHFSNITVSESNKAGTLLGLPEMPIENITFNDINIQAKEGFFVKNAYNVEFHDIQIDTDKGPAFNAELINSLELDGVNSLSPHKNTPVILLENIENAFIYNCFPRLGTDTFLEIKGDNTKNIVINGNNFSLVKNPIINDNKLDKEIVIQ